MSNKPRGGHIRKLGGNTFYRLIRVNGKQVLEHRHVMEQHLGRKLATSEIVHHIDGDGLNNDISNLEVMTQSVHRREHGGPRQWDLAEGIRMKEEGFTVTDIARHFGVSQASISKAFIRRGIDTFTPREGQHRKVNWDEAISLHKQGLSNSEIADIFSVTPQAIRAILVKTGNV